MLNIVKMIVLVSNGLISQVGGRQCSFVCIKFCNRGDACEPPNYVPVNHLEFNLSFLEREWKLECYAVHVAV